MPDKKCSIVFMNLDHVAIDSYCGYFLGFHWPDDYELVFIDTGSLIVPEPIAAIPHLRTIKVGGNLKYEQLYLEIAGQLRSEYLVFVIHPISCKEIIQKFTEQANSVGNMMISQGPEYTIIHRKTFLTAGSFIELTKKIKNMQQSVFNNKSLNKLMSSQEDFEEVLVNAQRKKQFFLKECDEYLKQNNDEGFYHTLFVRCLKYYLNSGIEFSNAPQVNYFYQNLLLDIEEKIPWMVGILQSYWHLRYDRPDNIVNNSMETQQAAAIMVSVFNERRFTELCFRAIRKFTGFPYSIIAVNNSTDDMQDFKKFVTEEGLIDQWFESGCNSHGEGLLSALSIVKDFRYIVTLDSDAIVIKQNWLTDFVSQLHQNNAGLIGPKAFPGAMTIKACGIHPCCMVIDQSRIGSKFQIDFRNGWPFDTGHLLTWDCLIHDIPIIKVSHENEGNYGINSSLINKSVRHYWYTSRISTLDDEDELDGQKVGLIRAKLNATYESDELNQIRKYRLPKILNPTD